jgi:hypothetical protein
MGWIAQLTETRCLGVCRVSFEKKSRIIIVPIFENLIRLFVLSCICLEVQCEGNE